ncbi:Uncharacterised protein [Mycobacteroides abscessus subsp. abscessus]|nr:Uncharacterised protein [Mycobacteroides abscessus subsp. abscessus]
MKAFFKLIAFEEKADSKSGCQCNDKTQPHSKTGHLRIIAKCHICRSNNDRVNKRSSKHKANSRINRHPFAYKSSNNRNNTAFACWKKGSRRTAHQYRHIFVLRYPFFNMVLSYKNLYKPGYKNTDQYKWKRLYQNTDKNRIQIEQ